MDRMIARMNWRADAAYLYVFELDALGLAWEYLRRNARYTAESKIPGASPDAWHLRNYEDPERDARFACPEWIPIAPCILRLVESDDPAARPFSIWNLPGAKTFYRSGKNLLLTIRVGAQARRLLLSAALRDGGVFAYQLPGGADPRLASPVISRINSLMSSRRSARPLLPGVTFRPSRDAMLHLRTLQALDAQAAGATHREVGEALFGADDVWRRWSKDSELRSYVRYLLRRGQKLVSGEYYGLLNCMR